MVRYSGSSTAAIVALVLLMAIAARFISLDHRPMHADEAVLADKFGSFLADGSYPYDPSEYHGPVLAYISWLPNRLAGHRTYASLTEWSLRATPAIAGVLLALTPLLLFRAFERTAALWAAAFLA